MHSPNRRIRALRFVAPCLFLLNSGVTAFAQTPDQTIQAFISSGNALISLMNTITTPSNAMIIAPDLKPLIDTYNTNGRAVKALYGQIFNTAALQALQANQAALNNLDQQLQNAQARLLTNGCGKATAGKNSSTTISMTFTNNTKFPLILWQISPTMVMSGVANIAPKQTVSLPSIGIDSVLTATKTDGASCLGYWPRAGSAPANVVINPILGPTVAVFLSKIAQ